MASDFTNMMTAGGAGLYDNLFGGNSGAPYDAAMRQYDKYTQKGEATQKPYLDAGQGAITDFQDWLKTQKDPSGFINHLMEQYQQSPYSKYLQNQSIRAGQNAGSASGLIGSTPMMEQMQQNATNISSQDQQDWLKNVLGINTNYGEGQKNLMEGGKNAANSLTDLYNQTGSRMGEASYNKNVGGKNDKAQQMAQIASIIKMLFL